MFSHVMIGANDLDASKRFYDAILGVLGYDEGVFDEGTDGQHDLPNRRVHVAGLQGR